MIKTYYELAKPGIVYGNMLAAVAGFFFGSGEYIEWGTFAAMVLGLSGIIASACVWNNIYDRHADARMERTKGRPLAAGEIPLKNAAAYALLLGTAGAAALAFFTNVLALVFALIGFAIYVLWYTPLKHRSATALYVGALAGATPPVVGYTAAAYALDAYALGLFAALFLWQIPHFLSIAVFRYDEYKAAGIPLLIQKAPGPEARKRARKIFFYSLLVLLAFCLILIVQRWIR